MTLIGRYMSREGHDDSHGQACGKGRTEWLSWAGTWQMKEQNDSHGHHVGYKGM